MKIKKIDDVVRERRSVRGFLPDKPVAPEVLNEILTLAQQAPSGCNVQPWRVFVTGGEKHKHLRERLLRAFDNQEPIESYAVVDAFFNEYRRLQIKCAVELYGHMGVERGDKSARVAAERRNFEFFNAPHTLFICMEKRFGVGVALDVGMYAQTLMLLMTSRGIASCPQAAMRHYERIIKAELNIPDNLQLLCGISFGYEDETVPANRTRQSREPIEANVVNCE